MQLPEHFLSDGTSSTTFSILVRIDPHAAHRYDCRRRNSSRLSVSSCGSTLMQHTAISGRRDAPRPFSILVRIDPHAAMIYQKRCSSSYIFQYPRADRPSCSLLSISFVRPLRSNLSVSSCGSTLMQPENRGIVPAVSERLSVSSCGSTLMQPSCTTANCQQC